MTEPSLIGPPNVVRLSAHHYDSRTLGMLHVTGQATDPVGDLRSWSCVIKVIDPRQPPRANTWVDAVTEVLVYRSKLFAADGQAFRPARCYLISETSDGNTLLWLEDLTGLQKPPFTLEELDAMAAHLGSWNAHHALTPPALPFAPDVNSFLMRWSRAPAVRQASRLRALQDHRYVGDAFRDVPFEAFDELLLLAETLNSRTARQPPSLCFGDCNVGNLFAGTGETVAVDWASLTLDPVGVDAGCMIGSAISWGPQCAAVAREERGLFDTYFSALAAAGLRATAADVRRGYFGHYGYYACFCAALPVLLIDRVFPISLIEQRFGAPADEIPDLVSGVIARLPSYVEEMRQLAT